MKQEYINLINKHSGNALQFQNGLQNVANRLSVPLHYIADIIYVESRFNPKAKNPASTASGLIQFIEATARGLGTTTANIRMMSNVQQLPLVERYLSESFRANGKPKSPFDTYLHVFHPSFLTKKETDTLSKTASIANKGLDFNKDGLVSKAEVRRWFDNQVGISEEKKSLLIFCVLALTALFITGKKSRFKI